MGSNITSLLATLRGRFLVFAADGVCVGASPDAARSFGAEPEELVGARIHELSIDREALQILTCLAEGDAAAAARESPRQTPAPTAPAAHHLVVWLPFCHAPSAAGALRRGAAAAIGGAVARLGGRLVSICSSCSSIRGDSGEWLPLAWILAQHIGLRFTHGLCDRCASTILTSAGSTVPRPGH